MLDFIKKIFKMKKNWNTLEKGDKLYLIIPYEDDGIIKYEFQESQVINVHIYDWCTNIRLKYTDKNINKRKRIELCINKNKYEEKYVAYSKNTEWAREYKVKWGDLIITYENPKYLNEVYNILIQSKIREQEALIESQKRYLEKIRDIQFYKVV